MKSNLISKTDTASMLKEISTQWKMDLPKIKNLKIYEVDDVSQIIVGEGLTALKVEKSYLPFLTDTKILERFPNVMVDMGAVKFMCDGANVMRPGIRSFTEFQAGDIVCVIEESKRNFLAVGRAMVHSSEMQAMAKGPVIENLHYISDKYWEARKSIKE